MAISQVENIYKFYDQNYSARDEIITLIRRSNNNLRVLVDISEFAASRGSNTVLYIELARYAASSRYASTEFVQIARKIGPNAHWSDWEHIAKALADANSAQEVGDLRREYHL